MLLISVWILCHKNLDLKDLLEHSPERTPTVQSALREEEFLVQYSSQVPVFSISVSEKFPSFLTCL